MHPNDDEPRTAHVRRVARRGDWIFGVVFLSALPCTFLAAGTIAIEFAPPRTIWGLLAIPAAWFSATFLGHFAQLGYVRHNHRRLKARNWNVCDSCGYDTTGTGESGTCPECGSLFSSDRLPEDFLLHQRGVKRTRMIPRFIPRVR